jgi:glycosyltransferase involved in cell wall biosynthesis
VSPERPVAYVLGTFPQASQTFIAREIRGLRQLDVPLLVFALGRRDAGALEETDRAWYGEVRFAPLPFGWATLASNLHFIVRAPGRYWRALISLLTLRHRPRVLALRAFALMLTGAWIARQIERAGGCRQVHAHFALAQTEVAMAVSGLLGCPFSFTAHARDIYATPSALEEKIRAAAVVVTCTAYNVDYLRNLCPDLPPEHVRLIYHGVDVDTLGAAIGSGRLAGSEPLVLAAGRLIEKKGFDTLIAACADLDRRGIVFRCRILGTGPLEQALRRQIASAGMNHRIELPGWVAPADVVRNMAAATVFTMPSRISDTGDRDGIPNVVLEAMAAGLPVVATEVSGIPEAVLHEETGLLVRPDAPLALADALEQIVADPRRAADLGGSGARLVRAQFAIEVSSRRLAATFLATGRGDANFGD